MFLVIISNVNPQHYSIHSISSWEKCNNISLSSLKSIQSFHLHQNDHLWNFSLLLKDNLLQFEVYHCLFERKSFPVLVFLVSNIPRLVLNLTEFVLYSHETGHKIRMIALIMIIDHCKVKMIIVKLRWSWLS